MIQDVPFPLPTLLVGGGLVLGFVLSLVSRIFVGLGARSKARRARTILTKRVAEVASREVVQPAQAELDALTDSRALLAKLS